MGMAQGRQNKNVFPKAVFAHTTESSTRQMELGLKNEITLQTSKLMHKCKELGVMKKSLMVWKESISILQRASHLLNVSPIITLAFPSLICCN